MTGPSAPPPRPWRVSARLLVLDGTDRVLAVPVDDGEGAWWDLPGGGLEGAESTAEAAVRETLEETGYTIDLDAVGPVQWDVEVCFRWLGAWQWSRQIVHVARVTAPGPPVPTTLTSVEVGFQGPPSWWPLPDVLAGRVAIAPFADPADLQVLLDGGALSQHLRTWPPPDPAGSAS